MFEKGLRGGKVVTRGEVFESPSQDAKGSDMLGQLGNRLLLVEDEPRLRRIISRQLMTAGYIVRVADDGLDAIGKLRAEVPDVIISDLNMPGMSGLEFLKVLRKRFPQIPVILITAVAADEVPAEVAADAYYHKNEFLAEQLLKTIPDLSNKLPLRDAPPPGTQGISRARRHGEDQFVIDCEDCLREFTVPRIHNLVRGENWAVCIHCEKLVQFLAAEDTGGR
jgi:CheY-like chemotaxis protein